MMIPIDIQSVFEDAIRNGQLLGFQILRALLVSLYNGRLSYFQQKRIKERKALKIMDVNLSTLATS